MTQRLFSLAFARVLKGFFPELGTDEYLDYSDTVDALGSLYTLAKNGALKMPRVRIKA
jgi:hypothetical protein